MATSPGSPTPMPPGVWRADRLADGGVAALPSTFAELDAQLPGGGWPLGMLTELIAREPGIGELRLLVPVLRRLTIERKVAILLGPPRTFGADELRQELLHLLGEVGRVLACTPHEVLVQGHVHRSLGGVDVVDAAHMRMVCA